MNSVIYEIYVRSFYDSNSDGIGDIKGITSKLNHLKNLGVDVIWLTPIFESPNFDYGYDVSDYYSINKEFGTIDDLIELINEAHKLNIKVLLDMVLNHCSYKHKWFIDATTNINSKYREYFYFSNTIKNNLGCQFEGSAWHKLNNEYYLGLFSKYQPDFNWNSTNLRHELMNIVEYYLKLGIDGFRFDVLSLIKKPNKFKYIKTDKEYADFKSYANYKGIDKYLKELSNLLNKYQAISIVEGSGLTLKEAVKYYKYFTYVLSFDLMNIDDSEIDKWSNKCFDIKDYINTIYMLEKKHSSKKTFLSFIENHDQPRIVSRFNEDKHLDKLTTLLPFISYFINGDILLFQGEEIGMTNNEYKDVKELKDIESINYYKQASNKEVALKLINQKSRDHARTIFQWNSSKYAGFSMAPPWNVVNKNYLDINVEKEKLEKDSILNIYRNIIKFKKEHFNSYRRIKMLKLNNEYLIFKRDEYYYLANITNKIINYNLDLKEIVFNNYLEYNKGQLLPYQTIIYKEEKRKDE